MKVNDKNINNDRKQALSRVYPVIFLYDRDPFTCPSMRITGIRYMIGYTARYPATEISEMDHNVFPLVARARLASVRVVENDSVVNPRQFRIVYGFNK